MALVPRPAAGMAPCRTAGMRLRSGRFCGLLLPSMGRFSRDLRDTTRGLPRGPPAGREGGDLPSGVGICFVRERCRLYRRLILITRCNYLIVLDTTVEPFPYHQSGKVLDLAEPYRAGRISLRDVACRLGLSPSEALDALQRLGISGNVSAADTLRSMTSFRAG